MLTEILATFACVIAAFFLLFKSRATDKKDVLASEQVVINGNDLASRIKKSHAKIVVFYGSQTGTAESYAQRLMKESLDFGIRALYIDLMDIDAVELCEFPGDCLAVFVLATYGEGEPTDNARDFFEWLQANEEDLSNINFTIFGLGNRTYTYFNAVARKTHAKLKSCHANPIHVCGEGDDNLDLEGDFLQWKEQMWQAVLQFFEIDISSIRPIVSRSFTFTIMSDSDHKHVYRGEHGTINAWNGKQNRISYSTEYPFYASVTESKNLYKPVSSYPDDPKVSRECYHIELDISNSSLRYQTGDHVAIFAPNDEKLVEQLATALGLNLDSVFDMRNPDPSLTASKRTPFPCPTTVKAALTFYLDINTIPKTNVLSLFARNAKQQVDRDHLQRLTMGEHKDFYNKYIVKDGRNILQVLLEHPSVSFEYKASVCGESDKAGTTVGDLFELLPRLQPRYYSIASSQRNFPASVHICATLVQFCKLPGHIVTGVATGHMREIWKSRNEDEQKIIRVPLFIRKSHFRMPRNQTVPIMLIGAGTGIAPLRAFIQERKSAIEAKIKEWYIKRRIPYDTKTHVKLSCSVSVRSCTGKLVVKRIPCAPCSTSSTPPIEKMMGDSLLFFGCRNRNEDFLYADELIPDVVTSEFAETDEGPETLMHNGISAMYCAFSRENPNRKVYVQHLLEEHAADIWDALSKNAYIYVCGDAKSMAMSVRETIMDIASKLGNLPRSAANEWLEKLRLSGRYQEDIY